MSNCVPHCGPIKRSDFTIQEEYDWYPGMKKDLWEYAVIERKDDSEPVLLFMDTAFGASEEQVRQVAMAKVAPELDSPDDAARLEVVCRRFRG